MANKEMNLVLRTKQTKYNILYYKATRAPSLTHLYTFLDTSWYYTLINHKCTQIKALDLKMAAVKDGSHFYPVYILGL